MLGIELHSPRQSVAQKTARARTQDAHTPPQRVILLDRIAVQSMQHKEDIVPNGQGSAPLVDHGLLCILRFAKGHCRCV